ncbi:MAG: NUDIX hydrolase [Gammaproteobacteria bacterium]|nr:NUDIX hydrolase [Gammaproteobacteria bacterium]
MNYCSHCGSKVTLKVPEGDNRSRHVCVQCDAIHYQNPRIIAGCLPIYDDSVLLCRRAIEPRAGKWTLPAGFMENGETTEEAALRETREEANARAEIMHLYTLFSLPHISQVYLFYRARLLDLQFSPGEESLEVALFHEKDIPWDELAFPVIVETLEHYFSDRKEDHFPVRSREIIFRRRKKDSP